VECNQKLARLGGVLQTLADQTGPISRAGAAELQEKRLVCDLISHRLSVLLWFFTAGLLPENDGAV